MKRRHFQCGPNENEAVFYRDMEMTKLFTTNGYKDALRFNI